MKNKIYIFGLILLWISAWSFGGTHSVSTTCEVDTTIEVDSDLDGLPDEWEQQYFDGSIDITPYSLAANGVNTARECYIAGLDPTSPTARFNIALEAVGVERVVQWNAASGRVYAVWGTTNLLSGFQSLRSNIPWTCSSFTNATPEPCEYYKVEVQVE